MSEPVLVRESLVGCVVKGPHYHDGNRSCGERGDDGRTLACCLGCRRLLLASQVAIHGWWEPRVALDAGVRRVATVNHRTVTRATRKAATCGCGRPATHPGVCRPRLEAKRADGWTMPTKRAPVEPPALEECLAALEELHLACIRFSFAFSRLRPGLITVEKLVAADPDEVKKRKAS